ncbi:ubiquinone/menaquinone biosynthesis C-methylase UbiE [Friedmanniella endophytica]|uniref:Ubiquinone/menaquinone biosynthesis C-methylase UbiE n=1 Tax=Microlunatus kandeliicorticis TaxID=1759536 RepID=A0A7W3ITE2_9ACTN|nr:class I SAM-dependent methyltransferase [Microlunatus kandeliicorticis]MBA8794870.1 ubiquinone/menaquinone biosynthesis C-methylase UbiE [Microlunatus kandeliicorticis]
MTAPTRAVPTTDLRPGLTGRVRESFDKAARRYDLMVALNPGYHRHLRQAATALIEKLPAGRSLRLADLGCGSGASTRALLDSHPAPDRVEIVGVDASSGMLAEAAAKSWPAGVSFHHGLAEDVAVRRAEWGLGRLRDGVLAAYLFRNVADRDATLAAVHAVIRPGGYLVTQEYSVADRPAARRVFSLVCWLVVIPLSLLTSGRSSIYRYLWQSVLDFDSVERFCERLTRAGFVDVEVRTVGGWQRNILHTFRARRP